MGRKFGDNEKKISYLNLYKLVNENKLLEQLMKPYYHYDTCKYPATVDIGIERLQDRS